MHNIIICGPGDETECVLLGKKLRLRHRFHEYSVQLVYIMRHLNIVLSTVYTSESIVQTTILPQTKN